jgi:hypothetical protein
MNLLADVDIPLMRRMVPLVLALIVLAVTIEMIRRRRLREEYAMLWLAASGVLLVFGIFPNMVIWLQTKLNLQYITIVVLAAFFFLAMIVMHFAMVISKQAEDIRQLAQRLALINQRLDESQKAKTADGGGQEPNSLNGKDA